MEFQKKFGDKRKRLSSHCKNLSLQDTELVSCIIGQITDVEFLNETC